MKFKKKHVFNQNNFDISEQFHTVYNNIKTKINQQNSILMVTSITQIQSIVNSTAYLSLAFSKQRKRVLLIDANLHQPSLHQVFCIKNSLGFGTLLLDEQNQYKIKPIKVADYLYCLPAGVSSYHAASLLWLESLPALIQVWKEQFDVILFYTSNYLNEPDARIIARHCDGTVLFIQEGYDKLSKIIKVKKDLEYSNNEIIGTVIIS